MFRYTLQNPNVEIEFPKALGEDGFTYYGAANRYNANPYLLARNMDTTPAESLPIGEVKQPLRADVERRVYVPQTTLYSASKLFKKTLSEHKTQFESVHKSEFKSARQDPGHKGGKHYHELSQSLTKGKTSLSIKKSIIKLLERDRHIFFIRVLNHLWRKKFSEFLPSFFTPFIKYTKF